MPLAKALLALAPVALGTGVCHDGSCPSQDGLDEQSLMQLARPAQPQHKFPPLVPPLTGRLTRDQQPYSCPLPTEECHLQDGETCDFNKMLPTKVHRVYPHGATMCLDSSKPFYFLVKRGATGKLLLVLEDGGACWDKDGFERTEYTCDREPTPGPWDGVLDFSDKRNPYHGYTIVRVPSCSGDLMSGHAEQPWGENGALVYQRGHENMQAVLAWASEQFKHLTKLTVLGTQTGGMVLQYWSDAILRELADRSHDVVVHADSFTGNLFPAPGMTLKESQAIVASVWKFCGNSALREEEQALCSSADFTWQDHFGRTMGRFPKVLFTMINSKTDYAQIGWNKYFVDFTEGEWYREASLLYKKLAANTNFRNYLINGDMYGHLMRKTFYTATPLGAEGTEGEPTLVSWIGDFEAYCGKNGITKVPGHACIGKSEVVTEDNPAVPEGLTWCEATFLG